MNESIPIIGTNEVGIEDDWQLWFDGHNVAEHVWQDSKLSNVELEFHRSSLIFLRLFRTISYDSFRVINVHLRVIWLTKGHLGSFGVI